MIERNHMSELNPLGEPKIIDEMKIYINNLAKEWDELIKEKSTSWWRGTKTNLIQVTKFLIKCLDELIIFVDGLIDSGPDKKATVLAAIAALYDYIIKEAMPIWLKPFANSIKQVIIYTIISAIIDFIVTKYRDGSWRIKDEDRDTENQV